MNTTTKSNVENPTYTVSPETIELLEDLKGYKESMTCYSCALMEVETKFKVLNAEFSVLRDRNPIQSIKYRLKSAKSIAQKLLRKNLDITIAAMEENLFDIAGIRIVCAFIEDIYFLADCLAKQNDISVLETKDYIKNPKENGYRSYHMIVKIPIFYANETKHIPVEIQFRTIAMDFWASLEHTLMYKKDKIDCENYVDELKYCAEASHALDLRMEKLMKLLK